MSLPDENTLGTIGGAQNRGPSGMLARVTREGTPRRASLGTGFIGIGAAVVFGLRAIYGFVWFLGQWSVYPNPAPALAAWIVLALVVGATLITARATGDRLPNSMFAIFLFGLASAIGLDLYAIWPLHNIGHFATAGASAGMALVIIISLRRGRDIIIAVSAIGVALVVAMVLDTNLLPEIIPQQLTTLTIAVLPAIVGAFVVNGFRQLVQVELDRVLVQSTVSAPRFAVGMMASEELARLDLAAEELLDSVSDGRIPLPLNPKTASTAASLATELRLHLIEGRRETWLYHAVTESDMLGKVVTLTDRSSLAGLLDPRQRDGLLAAAWLLVSDPRRRGKSRSVHLTLGPATDSVESAGGRRIVVPITIATTGVPRNRVDPATWEAISNIGQYSDTTQNSSLRVDIDCLVENPADH